MKCISKSVGNDCSFIDSTGNRENCIGNISKEKVLTDKFLEKDSLTFSKNIPKIAGGQWLISPDAFPISKVLFKEIKKLEYRLPILIKACEKIYHRSIRGSAPKLIHQVLDAGKPNFLKEINHDSKLYGRIPTIIRPDLLLTEKGFAISELDSVPGGFGLLAYLCDFYYNNLDQNVIGGSGAIPNLLQDIFPNGVDLVISQESQDYLSEMQYLVNILGKENWKIYSAETYTENKKRAVYRFFELFDYKNIKCFKNLARRTISDAPLSSSLQTFLEEKLWMAFLHSPGISEVWIRELRESNYNYFKKIIPMSWLMQPEKLPFYASYPGLNISSLEEVKYFSKINRKLVTKQSGFSESAWGSKSVVVGHDVSQSVWKNNIENTLSSYESNPYIMQKYEKPRRVYHKYWDILEKKLKTMEGRVRLTPYFFWNQEKKEAKLSSIMATICPADKKIIHGMKDAIIVPVKINDN